MADRGPIREILPPHAPGPCSPTQSRDHIRTSGFISQPLTLNERNCIASNGSSGGDYRFYICSAPYSSSNSRDRQGRGHGQISPGLRTPGPIHPFGVDGIAPPQPATQAALNPRLRHHFWPPSWATLLHCRSHPFNGAPFFPSSPMHCVHYRMPHRGLAGVHAHRTSRNRVCASRNDPVQPAPIKVKSPTSAGNITSQGRVRRGLGAGRHMRLSLAVRRIPNQPVPKFFDGQVANRFSLATPSPYVCDFPEPYHSSPNCSTPTFAREAGGVVTHCV